MVAEDCFNFLEPKTDSGLTALPKEICQLYVRRFTYRAILRKLLQHLKEIYRFSQDIIYSRNGVIGTLSMDINEILGFPSLPYDPLNHYHFLVCQHPLATVGTSSILPVPYSSESTVCFLYLSLVLETGLVILIQEWIEIRFTWFMLLDFEWSELYYSDRMIRR